MNIANLFNVSHTLTESPEMTDPGYLWMNLHRTYVTVHFNLSECFSVIVSPPIRLLDYAHYTTTPSISALYLLLPTCLSHNHHHPSQCDFPLIRLH